MALNTEQRIQIWTDRKTQLEQDIASAAQQLDELGELREVEQTAPLTEGAVTTSVEAQIDNVDKHLDFLNRSLKACDDRIKELKSSNK